MFGVTSSNEPIRGEFARKLMEAIAKPKSKAKERKPLCGNCDIVIRY